MGDKAGEKGGEKKNLEVAGRGGTKFLVFSWGADLTPQPKSIIRIMSQGRGCFPRMQPTLRYFYVFLQLGARPRPTPRSAPPSYELRLGASSQSSHQVFPQHGAPLPNASGGGVSPSGDLFLCVCLQPEPKLAMEVSDPNRHRSWSEDLTHPIIEPAHETAIGHVA